MSWWSLLSVDMLFYRYRLFGACHWLPYSKWVAQICHSVTHQNLCLLVLNPSLETLGNLGNSLDPNIIFVPQLPHFPFLSICDWLWMFQMVPIFPLALWDMMAFFRWDLQIIHYFCYCLMHFAVFVAYSLSYLNNVPESNFFPTQNSSRVVILVGINWVNVH